jgi:hypothetical protein
LCLRKILSWLDPQQSLLHNFLLSLHQLLHIIVSRYVPAIQEPRSRRTQSYGHSTGQLCNILCTRLLEIRCHIGVDNAWMEGNCRDILTLGCSVGCELEIRELGDGVVA